MSSPKKSLSTPLHIMARFVRAHGDLLFGAAFIFVIGYAAFLFYQFFYPPLFATRPPKPQETVFNTQLYQKVIDRIEARPRNLEEQLSGMPRNPF
ncbi:MAG: hypothetical protein Q7S09_01965 [bacterium]|nr:hypothetical protein [bacterium]